MISRFSADTERTTRLYSCQHNIFLHAGSNEKMNGPVQFGSPSQSVYAAMRVRSITISVVSVRVFV